MQVISAVDRNQGQIVRTFRQFGATVCHLHQVGGGCPDLLIGYRNANLLVEVKTGTGKLRETQKVFVATWKGLKPTIVRNREDVINLLETIRETK